LRSIALKPRTAASAYCRRARSNRCPAPLRPLRTNPTSKPRKRSAPAWTPP
jgi:hypothetical protein